VEETIDELEGLIKDEKEVGTVNVLLDIVMLDSATVDRVEDVS